MAHASAVLFESSEHVSYRVIAEARSASYLYRSGVTREGGERARILVVATAMRSMVSRKPSTPFRTIWRRRVASLMQLGDLEEEYVPDEPDDRKANVERQDAREMREQEMMDMLASRRHHSRLPESHAQNGAARTHQMDGGEWQDLRLVPGEYNTQTNCFYVAWWSAAKPHLKFLTECRRWLEGKRTGVQTLTTLPE